MKSNIKPKYVVYIATSEEPYSPREGRVILMREPLVRDWPDCTSCMMIPGAVDPND